MFKKKADKGQNLEIIEALDDFRTGSAAAFKILYKEYNPKVYSFCLRMLRDEAQAKDAFQEVFIKVYENASKFHGQNFAAWLFTIARHTCLNVIRGRKDHDSYDDVFHGQSVEINSDIGMKKFIEESISSLPEVLREALILREYQEYSYKEISEILDIELSLAKVRVHRARVMLRKLLKPLAKEINESR